MAQQVRDRVKLVFLFVKNVPNTCIDENFEAVNTWSMRNIDIGIADRIPVAGRLRYCVYLGVDRPVTVLFAFSVWRT